MSVRQVYFEGIVFYNNSLTIRELHSGLYTLCDSNLHSMYYISLINAVRCPNFLEGG